jgi:D-psicose/D-tagatose/L-ribulose 3-epimerase
MTLFGVIAPLDRAAAALDAGADYVEPLIVGNVVEQSKTGDWILNPKFAGGRFPSFAILVPADIRVADPEVPVDVVSEYFETVLGLVASVAAPGAKVVFGSGRSRTVPEGADRAVAEARFAESLRVARDAALAVDLQIILEPLNTGETNLVNSIEEAAAFLDAHGIEGVPIVADLFHLQLQGESLSVVRQLGRRIGHAHIADTGRRYIGSGDWPWPEFLEALREGGYEGSVSLECHWGDDFRGEVESSLRSLRIGNTAIR